MNQQQQSQRISTLIRNEAEQKLQQINVAPGSTKMAPKKMAGTAGQQMGKVLTNLHQLDMHKKTTIYRYHVNIDGIGRDGRPISLTPESPRQSDYWKVQNRYICNGVFDLFIRQIGAERCLFYYSLHHQLFSLMDLKLPKDGAGTQIQHRELQSLLADIYERFDHYKIKVTSIEGTLTLADFSFLTDDADVMDNGLAQFLNIATSQEIFDKPHKYTNYSSSLYYMLDPSALGFTQADCPIFKSNSSFLGIGVHKSMRPIQSQNSNEVTAALVVDVKKTAFHMDVGETIFVKVMKILDEKKLVQPIESLTAEQIIGHVENYIKGLVIQTRHGGRLQHFEIKELANTTAHLKTFEWDGTTVSIYDYFNKRYDHAIQNAHQMPLIVRRRGGRDDSYYPLDVCFVLDDQRVKGAQQDREQIKQMIRECAIPPARKFEQNQRMMETLRHRNSDYLRSAGLQLHDEVIEVNARVLAPPHIQFDVVKQPQAGCKWSGSRYLIPAACDKWAALSFSCSKKTLSPANWTIFVRSFLQQIQSMGMHFPQPERIDSFSSSTTDKVKQEIKQLEQGGFEYVLIAHPDHADEVHHAMKFWEQNTEVVTQGVKFSTVDAVNGGKRHSLENIVHKTNMKMGGLNYTLNFAPNPQLQVFFGKDTLIVAFAMNHPGPGSRTNGIGDNMYPSDNGKENGNGNNHSSGNGANGPPSGNGANGPNGNGNGGGGNGQTAQGTSTQQGTSTTQQGTSTTQQGTSTTQQSPSTTQQGTSTQQDAPQEAPINPSVVGFAANIGKKHQFEFIGDFVYQAPLRCEKISVIEHAMERCVKKFLEANKQAPRCVIIYRDGCDEGLYKDILKYEVPLLRHTLAQLGCTAQITLMVVNKMQPVRLFRKNMDRNADAPEQNIPPGTVVDTGIVHPKWTEFFLNSHRALQGTAKTPYYTVLLDENNLEQDLLQSVTNYLCYGHQIVNSPTSLPTPVFIAIEYAKRGRNIYNSWLKSRNGTRRNGALRTYPQLTEFLGYANTQFLKDLRVNA